VAKIKRVIHLWLSTAVEIHAAYLMPPSNLTQRQQESSLVLCCLIVFAYSRVNNLPAAPNVLLVVYSSTPLPKVAHFPSAGTKKPALS